MLPSMGLQIVGHDWVTEVGWHHQFNGHDSEQTPGDSEGQGSQACYNHGVAKNWTLLSN